ncbi:MAG: 50S ribosomal protein L19 [Elusimicrobia bacterium ADurb.Bin231]|nr:MAG: 50S ribosomal protein L19 [Elusimicrobia bacterium ADurb.Bin231]
MSNLIDLVEEGQLKKNKTELKPGDLVKVFYKIIEGDSERLQAFEGHVLRIKGRGVGETITVRKISFGVGVERIFLSNSPRIERIEILKHARVRRSRLYYLRNLSGKSARLKEIGANVKSSSGTAQTSAS